MDIKQNKRDKIQLLRAFAIIAVVFIHTCLDDVVGVGIRNFINYAVALFIFISGYLFNVPVTNIIEFYKKKFIRVLVPYIIWTIIYSVIYYLCSKNNEPLFLATVKNIITAKASPPFYFILVYMQLVLIHPFIYKLVNSKYWFSGFLISPISIILLLYVPSIYYNYPLLKYYSYPFTMWFIFYYLAVCAKTMPNLLTVKKLTKGWQCGLIILMILQIIESYAWYSHGMPRVAVNQLKLTSVMYNCMLLTLCFYFIENNNIKLQDAFYNKCLIVVGDFSFGIFFLHMLIKDALHFFKIIPVYSIPFPLYSIVITVVTFIAVIIISKVFGKNVTKLLGLK